MATCGANAGIKSMEAPRVSAPDAQQGVPAAQDGTLSLSSPDTTLADTMRSPSSSLPTASRP